MRPLPRRALLVAVLFSGMAAPVCATVTACAPFGAKALVPQSPRSAILQPKALEGQRSEGFFETTLVAAPATVPLRDGRPAEVWAYNGAVPGPTLDVTEGDRVVVHFKNNLPEPSNVHWHGLHVPPDQDGLPMDLVPPGGLRDYVFTVPRGTAGTYWYHPHPHGSTATQVVAGLAGALRVRPAPGADPVSPSFGDDILFLADQRFGRDGNVAPLTPFERANGRAGDVILVNGRERPQLAVRSGEIRRLRFINASSAQAWRLQIPDHRFLLIGTDGGFIGSPVEREEIRLAPAERADVLVRMHASPGTKAELVALPYGHSFARDPAASHDSDAAHPHDPDATHAPSTGESAAPDPEAPRVLVDIVYSHESPVTPDPVPGVLRPIAPLPLAGAIHRTLVLREFSIDDKVYDPDRVDIRGKLGSTEVWTVRNDGRMDHPFHLHGFQFQVLDRNGAQEPFRSWKDTVMVGNSQSVRFAVHFDDFPGPRIYHCHVLWHEDRGMMGLLQVDP